MTTSTAVIDGRTVLDRFRNAVSTMPTRPAVIYFGTVLSLADLNRASDELAACLHAQGLARGDRLALYLQNMPQYLIGLLAAWKLGGIGVPVNPMLKANEVGKILDDATPRILIALDELCTGALRQMLARSSVRQVITTSALDWAGDTDARVLPAERAAVPDGAVDLIDLLDRHAGEVPQAFSPEPDDVAVITYTSGTTGVPKGAMNTHRNVAVGGAAYCDWFSLSSADIVLAVAPLFHVTGLTGHIACALSAPAPLILCYRFHPDMIVQVIRRHRPTFTVAAITALIALVDSDATRDDLASLTKIASGGAPVAIGVVERFEHRFGAYIRNVYGMTETTSPVLAVPPAGRAPVEKRTGALSVGVPVLSARVAVLDDEGAQIGPGQIGELAVDGPQIVPGYWRNAEAGAEARTGNWFRTGDVGYVDDGGWYYLVDRKKDVIIASGFKVWPREVEDVLYSHAAVLEAGVVGRPDPYRGESVVAYVSVREGFTIEPGELVQFCRDRLAAYKYPREIEIVDAIPKTVTGKILRRNLRETAAGG
ncbi:AMP-binding protein [Mycobacterium sp.]|uniref:class I adenylate-forming enzyme family protein n=1 Tax=Mycobacterium sp. TaxID=1785 RepID=UPI001216CAF9|nr:AMP-binding protein [Mycobacterium sp.]TAM65177.1 MAG: long-chain fatty acid--CoA ligase [Mycobacterium sp.]